MPLQIRRGTQAQVDLITPLEGEPIFVTDQDKLVIGDGTTQGGINITANLQDLRISSSGITTSLYDSDSTGTVQLINGTNDNKIALNSTGTTITGPLFIANTATVNAIRFSDGSVQTTADTANPNQSLNTTSNVIFNSVQIAGNSGDIVSKIASGVRVATTGSLELQAPNGVAINGDTAGNANLYVDKIQEREPGGNINFLDNAQFMGVAQFGSTATNNITWEATDGGRLRLNSANTLYLNATSVIVPVGALIVDEIDALGGSTSVDFLTTASFTDILIGTEKVTQTDYQTVNFPNNINVANVLVVGSGSGNGYITSKGDNPLELGTSDNDGPGPRIVIGTGNGSTIQFKDYAERAIAEFSTSTVTLKQTVSVGSGTGEGIISSNGNYALKLRTNDGGDGTQIQMNQSSIQAQVKEGGYRSLYTLSTGTAQFNSDSYDFEDQNGTNILAMNSSAIETYQPIYIGGVGGGNVGTLNTLPNGGSTLVITNTSTLGFINVGPLNSVYSIPGFTTAATASVFDQTGNNSQIWFRTRSSTNSRLMAMDQNGTLRFTRNQQIAPSATNGSIVLADGTGTNSLYGGITLTSGAAGSTATTVNINRLGIESIFRSTTGTTRLIVQGMTDGTWTNRMSVTGLAGPFLVPFEQNTNTTYLRAFDAASATTLSTVTFANNLLSMTDSANVSVFSADNAGFNITNTATIAGLKIGYNNSEISIPNVTADADNMWIRTTGNSGAIISTCLTSAGVKRNMAWANGRLRFDSYQTIYPNPTTGALTLQGGNDGSVDGIVQLQDYNGNNFIQIDPSQGVNIVTTASTQWSFTVEGMAQLPVVTQAPATPTVGMMAVADAVTWDPATYSTTTAYVAFYNGTAWVALG